MDIQEIQIMREELERQVDDYSKKLNKAVNALSKLQRECKHPNIVEKDPWQGGGKYYTHASCPDCGKNGTKYSPELTRSENIAWDTQWNRTLKGEEYYLQLDKEEKRNLFGNWWD